MLRVPRFIYAGILLIPALCSFALAQEIELRNSSTVAQFGSRGLISVSDAASGSRIDLSADEWSIVLDARTLRSQDSQNVRRKTAQNEIIYDFDLTPYRVQAVYQIKPEWGFITKQLRITSAPGQSFSVGKVVPWDLKVKTAVESDFVPSVYVPQFGATLEQSKKSLPGKDYGEFLRFDNDKGAFLTVQNPFLEVHREAESISISYAPEMEWQSSFGEFTSDIACIGAYRLTGIRNAREMVKEWHSAPRADTQRRHG